MHFDVETLSRLQFAFTVMFHYLYPPLSIGLSTMLIVMEALYLKTKNPIYEVMCKFWVKVFALNFSIGVATGIVMQFEFGTNWATYSRFVGDIFGSALAAEGIFAFFLESGFLAILLFGWNRVSPKVHFFATVMVCFGATFSAFWITVANSWMQTPAGFNIVGDGETARAVVSNFHDMVFNPSTVYRFLHVLVGGWITGAFFVMSVSAYYILKGRHLEFARRSFVLALILAAASTVSQAYLGSKQAEVVAKYQPAKLAAYEGHFHTGPGAAIWLFGIPDPNTHEVKYGIRIPGLLSWLATGDTDGVVQGLDDFAPQDRPPVVLPFEAYHSMIGIGMYLIALSAIGVFLLWRRRLFSSKLIMRLFVLSVLAPYVANQYGWIAAEVGRQPWIVYGLLRTSAGLSKAVAGEAVLASLILFSLLYALLFVVFLWSLDRKIKHGPEDAATPSVPPKKLLPPMNWKAPLRSLIELASKRLDPSKSNEEDQSPEKQPAKPEDKERFDNDRP